MTRIFSALSVVAIALLAFTLVVGLWLGELAEPLQRSIEVRAELSVLPEDHPAREALLAEIERIDRRLAWANGHRLLGVASVLAVLLVNSVSVTYFIGTSRWVREVSEAYSLGDALLRQSQRLKRRAFPWALTAIVAALAIAGLGAAGDPASAVASPTMADFHFATSLLGFPLIGWALVSQWNRIRENHRIIDEVVAEVGEVRRERASATS